VERPSRGSILERARDEVLIVGAGNGGQQVASSCAATPACGARRWASSTTTRASRACGWPGIKVLGTTANLPRILDGVQPDEVIIAIPSAPGTLRQQVVTACRERSIPVRTLPTTFELLSGRVNLMRQVREVRVEDVLGRDPVRVEIDRVGAYLRGRTVLVTGRGRVDRRELSRQIARVGAQAPDPVENSRTRCSRSAAS
jgi:FlaA1/EpsC-like NDP-sugar epimerase